MDDYESYEEIICGLTEPVSRVQISIPDSLRDGSRQNILLRFQTKEGEIEVRDEMTMPFGIREPEPTMEPEPTKEPEELPTQEPVEEVIDAVMLAETDEEDGGVDFVSVIAIVMILAAVCCFIYMKWKKKNAHSPQNRQSKENEISAAFGIEDAVSEPEEEQKTMFLGEDEGEQKTVFLGGINNPDSKVLVVRDAEHPEKVFRYPLRGRVVIGRRKDHDTYQDVNIVINYDSSVSGRHLAVSMQGTRLYIEDLNSSNGTFLNGERIKGIVPIAPGCQVELGRVKVIFDIE